MRGQMMEMPLTITSILRHAEANHCGREIVTVRADRGRHRLSYGAAFARARRLANALKKLGVHQGERVATLAWNDHRHFEAYYGVSCMGAVLHTVNPRLFPEQISYIINHGAAGVLLTDRAFVPLLESLYKQLRAVQHWVILCDEADLPATALPGAVSYETLIGAESDSFSWPDLDENAASTMCYTSGTTGNPKGVVYSHRATVLHSYGTAMPDALDLHASDIVLPLTPMFHVNAWGMPYTVPMVGATLVLPGPFAGEAAVMQDVIEAERITVTLGVPTLWLGLLAYLESSGKTVASLRRVIVGGSAVPASVITGFDRHGVDVRHAWGMTEMTPLGTANAPFQCMEGRAPDDDLRARLSQGRALYGVEMKIVDQENQVLPWDGAATGRLKVRGPWVASGYYLPDEGVVSHDADGWFETGDVASIDPDGFLRITDRTKDLIKSGGEWISSIELENLAISHPQVAEAAVIGVRHPKWSERPLLIVVPKPGIVPRREDLLAWYEGRVAKWWIPDDVAFVDKLPHTATGKVSKLQLREQFGSHYDRATGDSNHG